MASSDYKVRIVNVSGEADMSVTVIGDQVVDLTEADVGDVLTVQEDGTVAPAAPAALLGLQPGTGLAWVESSDAVPVIGGEIDLPDMVTEPFDSPADHDLLVTASVPLIGAVTAMSTVTIKLCDAANVAKKQDAVKSGTASANHGHVTIRELIPAGSGTGLVRKLRAVSTGADGYANLDGGSTMTLDVVVR